MSVSPNITTELTPRQIVAELDKYIIGQEKAKKAVAIALRNRTRRQKLSPEMKDEVAPKNIIMIGPTGVGKTEIARRLSKLSGAPFLKVEATKFTEVGYVGRDVESMVRDLLSSAISLVKAERKEEVKEEAAAQAEERLLDLLLPQDKGRGGQEEGEPETTADAKTVRPRGISPETREKMRERLREGKLEEKKVEVSVQKQGSPAIEVFSGQNFEEIDMNLGNLSSLFGGGKEKKKKVTVAKAREILIGQETEKLVDQEQITEEARRRVQEMGIIFIDELDKVTAGDNRTSGDVSREGVQRDILPIVEGSTVNTKHGMVDTSHILFVAAGAFHTSKPSDLIPELQGRFPLRVELEDLNAQEFRKILTQPKNALIRQYTELLRTEDVTLKFSEEAIDRLSEIAAQVNSRTDNIGARRLHTIMELLLEEVSYTAPELAGQTIPITPEYVEERLSDVIEDQDLSRYIL